MSPDPAPPLDSFDETDRPLVRSLRDDDPEARAVALAEIADVVDDALARELLRFARDPNRDPEERARALIALGPALQMCWEDEDDDGTLPAAPPDASAFEEAFFEHPLSNAVYAQVLETLRRLYHDADLPKLLRRRALEASVRAPREWQRDATRAAWGSGDPEWRVTALFAMGFLGSLRDGGFREEISEAFFSDDSVLRREAILAAGRGGIEDLTGPMMHLAGDPNVDREDRLAAIEALGEMAEEGASDLLSELTEDPDVEIAETARWALEEALLFSDAALYGDLDDLGLDDLDDPDEH